MIFREQPAGLQLQAYLDAEQRLAADFPDLSPEEQEEGLFFIWQSPPTVICGHNQVIGNEVNLAYCREKGIAVVQRKSGGGAVYSDSGNVMISFILPRGPVETVFARVLNQMTTFLRTLGLDAERSGRNDILLGGRKVSGNAFFQSPTASIVHGTFLFDADFDALEKALTPPEEKLSRHGVASVRQRVANLRPLLGPMDVHTFIQKLKEYFNTTHYV